MRHLYYHSITAGYKKKQKNTYCRFTQMQSWVKYAMAVFLASKRDNKLDI